MKPVRLGRWRFAWIVVGTILSGAASASEPVHLLVPAYFYPAGDGLKQWERLLQTSNDKVVAIVNPDSGPGKRVDANYLQIFRRAKRTQIALVGYVTLSYGKRPLSAVLADIDSWLYFYPDTQGIFFDEQPSQADGVAFFRSAVDYARKKIDNARVFSNPGVACEPEYFGGIHAPAICVLEHETGLTRYHRPSALEKLDVRRFVLLLYNQPNDQWQDRLKEAREKGFGWVYLTDAPGPMPWGRLPSYWEELVKRTK